MSSAFELVNHPFCMECVSIFNSCQMPEYIWCTLDAHAHTHTQTRNEQTNAHTHTCAAMVRCMDGDIHMHVDGLAH